MVGLIEQPLTVRLFELTPAVLVIEIVRLVVVPNALTPNAIGPAAGVVLIWAGSRVPAGQLNWKFTAVGVPPRFSVHDKVWVTALAPKVQVPVSGLPEIAPEPIAVTLPEKPVNGAVGAVQDVIVVALAPLPLPAVPMLAASVRLPVVPMVVPPVAVIVPAAAGA